MSAYARLVVILRYPIVPRVDRGRCVDASGAAVDRERPLREAVAVAVPRAAKAIAVASIALAASFAVLGLVPLRPFLEFAFIMSVGVLIDSFVVRSLLVPALITPFGEVSAWPAKGFRAVLAAESERGV